MFETAGVCSMRRVREALLIVSLAVLLGACAHPSPPDPGGPKSWVIENVASKSTAALYADLIKPGVFERSSSKVIDGYTVESGNLRMPDRSLGSLITVRAGDGSLTAVIEKAGKSGLLVINNQGDSRFTPFPVRVYSLPDTVVGKAVPIKPTKSTAPYVIDMLIGYSRSAVETVGGDAHAHALAQVESVNLALRNSLVTNVSMRLIGVQVVEQNYPLNQQTLNKLPEIFATGMQELEPDMLFGTFSGHPDDTAIGWANQPGNTAVGYVNFSGNFSHEIAHNAGSGHCHETGGGYNFGHNNGKNGTILCGEDTPYYSNPSVRDEFGLPRGDATTADTARVWRENAERLSSYAPPFEGERMILAGAGTEAMAALMIPTMREGGVVALSADVGPVQLEFGGLGPFTVLTATLKDSAGTPHEVKLRGTRKVGSCPTAAMHHGVGCFDVGMYIVISYSKSDNAGLSPGFYTGSIHLKAVNGAGTWSRPIKVSISVSGD